MTPHQHVFQFPPPATPAEIEASARLARIVEANRRAPATRDYRQHHNAAKLGKRRAHG